MEREYEKTSSSDMFDFRKPNVNIAEQIKKVENTGYKKLAFISIAVAALLSVGLTLGNIGVVQYKSNLEMERLQEISNIEQQNKSAQQALQLQQKAKEANTLEQQKQLDFLANKIKSIDKSSFSNFISYLESHKNLYDDNVKTIRKSLFEAQSIDRAHAIDPNTTTKDLEIALLNYKKDLEEVISKTSNIYSSVQDNRVKEDKVTMDDMKTFLKLHEQFSYGLVILNKPIELKIKNILYIKNQANVRYNNTHDVFKTVTETQEEAVKNIKKFKP